MGRRGEGEGEGAGVGREGGKSGGEKKEREEGGQNTQRLAMATRHTTKFLQAGRQPLAHCEPSWLDNEPASTQLAPH